MTNPFGDTPIDAGTDRVNQFGDVSKTEADPNLPWGNALVESFKNIPGSAAAFGKEIWDAVSSPQETKDAVFRLLGSAVAKVVPEEQAEERHFDMMVDFMKARYGDEEALKQTIAQDPVGVLGDISSAVAPGGLALKGFGSAAKLGALEKVGQVVAKAGAAIDPISGAKAAVKPLSILIPKGVPPKIYERAVNFSASIPANKRRALADTAIAEQIPPTLAGLDTLRAKINVASKAIDDKIDLATAQGNKIKISDFFDEMDDLRDQRIFASEQRAINRIVKDFVQEQAINKGRLTVTPSEAQTIKKQLNQDLRKAYESMVAKPITTETKKAINRGVRKSIEAIIPEVKDMNKNVGAMLELEKQLTKRVNTLSKAKLIDLMTVAKGGFGGALAGPAGAASIIALDLVNTPAIKSKLAIQLNKMKNAGSTLSPETISFIEGVRQTENIDEE